MGSEFFEKTLLATPSCTHTCDPNRLVVSLQYTSLKPIQQYWVARACSVKDTHFLLEISTCITITSPIIVDYKHNNLNNLWDFGPNLGMIMLCHSHSGRQDPRHVATLSGIPDDPQPSYSTTSCRPYIPLPGRAQRHHREVRGGPETMGSSALAKEDRCRQPVHGTHTTTCPPPAR